MLSYPSSSCDVEMFRFWANVFSFISQLSISLRLSTASFFGFKSFDAWQCGQVALEMISRQRGLEYKNNPQEDMATLLEYEANVQCKDPDEVSWLWSLFSNWWLPGMSKTQHVNLCLPCCFFNFAPVVAAIRFPKSCRSCSPLGFLQSRFVK